MRRVLVVISFTIIGAVLGASTGDTRFGIISGLGIGAILASSRSALMN